MRVRAAAVTAKRWIEIDREMQISPQGSRESQWVALKSVPMPQQLERPMVEQQEVRYSYVGSRYLVLTTTEGKIEKREKKGR